ncbi:hypothetical protein DTO166G4_7017 [Paecilomyces variotii]|nr:hypothetical protein DTO164E3_2346 [Paecilomyces variotii]KAJ9211395.1 hypothetical protein DTO166G4_7017 [Paecilomyces variotii]KAJ9225898.1 hypothetical protein DTO169C6_1961 [Paecilomyces variotii]KAJ9233943.1 hypothetical protein DTO166G5_5435 [Paecilomyces variotii]KAJ9239691.1 hypothetical protein DTO169E5_4203 [Paecilomyces variotii]
MAVTKTFAYKNIQGKPLELDVIVADEKPSQAQPAILFYHGGYLITGDRHHAPRWLIQAALKRRWAFISADYRTLPESTGFELAEDLFDAYKFVTKKLNTEIPNLVDPTRLIVAGSSGGGYCSILGAVRFKDPAPVAVLPIYPMGDPTSEKWTIGKHWTKHLSASATEETIKEMNQRIADKEISTGQRFPADPKGPNFENHNRWRYVRAILESGLYVDYLTGVKGLGAAIAEKGKDAIPENARELFPKDFSITKDLPPLIVVHGLEDRQVPHEDGEAIVQKSREAGVNVTYFPVEGADHDFDLKYDSIEDDKDTQDPGKKALLGCLEALDKLVPSSA